MFLPIDSIHEALFATNSSPFLPKLYGIYKDIESIDFEALPESFVLKTNHDSGGVVIVPNKQEFLADSQIFTQSLEKLKKHLNTNFYTLYREWHYKDIEARIFAEELLGDANAIDFQPPDDFKVHCFGNTMFMQVDSNRFTNHTRTMFDSQWHKMPFSLCYKNPDFIPNEPKNVESMFEIAQILGKDFGGVRIDLYNICGRIIVGEITFTHGGGTERFYPNEWDKKLGDLWIL